MWQREMSVSYDKVGDAQLAQGDLAGALKSYFDSLAILERLAKTDPGNADGRAICPWRTVRSATCGWRRATLRGR
jgi:hypothetical protein